ncbi:MAG: ketosteroid isomerase-like protein [Gammaproteobacteria bacterium]|jgi:ketosteroid isomerase-like protein
MKIRTTAIIAVVLSLLVPVTAEAETVLEQLDAANKAFAKAIVAGDIDYLVNDYTDDACIIAPKAPLICGKEAIRPFWTSVVGSNPKNVELITHIAEKEGNLSYATGELIITDAESAVHKSRFVLVFKLVDGAWKLHVDSWTPQ